jgi:hypothetical protein
MMFLYAYRFNRTNFPVNPELMAGFRNHTFIPVPGDTQVEMLNTA